VLNTPSPGTIPNRSEFNTGEKTSACSGHIKQKRLFEGRQGGRRGRRPLAAKATLLTVGFGPSSSVSRSL
jgi:hypothetical protein